MKKLRQSRRTVLKVLVLGGTTAITLLAIELFFYAYFFHVLPEAKRNSILYLVGTDDRIRAKSGSTKIRPYLWSNYRPNPASNYANEHGWRYGGGPKKSPLRILCLGGSTTWGEGVSDPMQSYPAQMERFLRNQGYDVDVVNGGCPYYTTAEMVGTLAFRGIYENPQIVLIHEGGNDIVPLLSPREYKPDYSHWRTADSRPDVPNRLALFRLVWRIPSWTIRSLAWRILRPDPYENAMLARQLDSIQEALLSTNDVTRRHNVGYEKNLDTLIAISRIHNAIPILITFNWPAARLYFLVPRMKDDRQLAERINRRVSWAMEQDNKIMQDVGKERGVDVIPFHDWHPSREEFWVDQCHLDSRGEKEKAEYIGTWLSKHGYLKNTLQELAGSRKRRA